MKFLHNLSLSTAQKTETRCSQWIHIFIKFATVLEERCGAETSRSLKNSLELLYTTEFDSEKADNALSFILITTETITELSLFNNGSSSQTRRDITRQRKLLSDTTLCRLSFARKFDRSNWIAGWRWQRGGEFIARNYRQIVWSSFHLSKHWIFTRPI